MGNKAPSNGSKNTSVVHTLLARGPTVWTDLIKCRTILKSIWLQRKVKKRNETKLRRKIYIMESRMANRLKFSWVWNVNVKWKKNIFFCIHLKCTNIKIVNLCGMIIQVEKLNVLKSIICVCMLIFLSFKKCAFATKHGTFSFGLSMN